MKKQRSIFVWTKGIFNLPIGDRSSRYLFWEIDTFSRVVFNLVVKVFKENGLAVYWHVTANGFHFYNFKIMTISEHSKIVRLLKPTNHDFTPNTLRIQANKWQDENEQWKIGAIEAPLMSEMEMADPNNMNQLIELQRFRDWLENQKLNKIAEMYLVQPYPLEECPNCKRDGKIFCRRKDNKFICMKCHTEAIPRGGR